MNCWLKLAMKVIRLARVWTRQGGFDALLRLKLGIPPGARSRFFFFFIRSSNPKRVSHVEKDQFGVFGWSIERVSSLEVG